MKAQMPAAGIPCPSTVLGYPVPDLVQLLPPVELGLSPQVGSGLWLTDTEHAEHLPA